MRPVAFRFVVTHTGERVDRLVADATGRGRRAVRQWLLAGGVRVDGRVARAADVPAAGSEVVIEETDHGVTATTPSFTPRIVVENDRFVVVAKPAGMHCERGKSTGSLAELMEARYGDLSQVGDRPGEAGLVHRIDRDTSGLVVVARERATWLRFRAAFSNGRSRKRYLALAAGRLEEAREIEIPLARRGNRMTPASQYDDALPATTIVEALEGADDWTLVLATMTTGVMHQVRVHLAAIGHPLFGDALYGGPPLEHCRREGQLLHAQRVEIAGEIDVSVGPPEDFLAACAHLRGLDRAATSSS